MNQPSNAPRKKILTWLIGFFAVMLVLTIFAQSLRTMAIAQVTFARPRAQTIVRQFNGSGAVGVSESYPFLMDVNLKDSGLIIDSVSVAAEDRVESGDEILRVNRDRLEHALAQAREKQDKALSEAETKFAEAQSALDEAQNAMDSGALEAQRKLEDAAYKYEAAEVANAAAPTDAAQKEKYDTAALALKRAKEDEESFRIQNQNKVSAARTKLQAAESVFNTLNSESSSDVRLLTSLLENDGVLHAAEPGIITKTEAKAGTPLADVLAYIAPPDAPLVVSCMAGKEVVEGFKEGDAVYVKLNGEQLELTLTSMAAVNDGSDENDGAEKVELKIALGEYAAALGEKAKISLYSESGEYDCVIPLNALHREANAAYVLVAKEEGDGKYSTARVDVTVLAQDSKNAAVSGALTSTDRVITGSNKPIQEGDTVQEVRTA